MEGTGILNQQIHQLNPCKKNQDTPPVKNPPEKPKVTPPVKSPVKKTQKVSLCNKRNPEPPCPGMVVRKRPNCVDCCF